MDIPEAVVERYGAEQAALMRSARAKIREVSKLLDWSVGYEEMLMNKEAMAVTMMDVISAHGAAAAANAAELFEAVDEAFTGSYKVATLAGDEVLEAVSSCVNFAAGSLFPGDGMPPDVASFTSRLENAAVRMVNKYAMDTMAANDRYDVMYRRVTSGANVCPVCEDLASRGFVWEVDELIEPHDGCMCSLIPGFDEPRLTGGDPYPELRDLF